MRTACLGLVLLFAQVAAAQTPPDAKSLLEREQTALDAFTTYRYEEKTTTSMFVEGMPMNIEVTTSVKGLNPGKRRSETQMAGMVASMMIADGRDTWIYIPTANQYMRIGDDPTLANALVGLNGLGQLGQLPAGDAKVLRSESVQVDGTPHDCWVVESRIDRLSPGFVEIRNVVVTSWIDKQLGVSLRLRMSARVDGGPVPAALEMQVETVKRGLVFNEPMPDSLFVFTPPPGAKELDFSGGGIFGFSAPLEPTAPPEPPARPEPGKPRSPEEPQAFVPLLNPIELIVPEWPAGERGVAHPVEVLVTINAGGAVVDAEALTGTEQARAAAVSTVRQSTFRPVIRDGRPVAAYTSVSVPVVNVSTTKLELNVRDELAAATRVAALERAWPRSAEQVFLDLNNDLEGADPFMRQAFLPQLAKAALKAGRIGDAERYATEVLGDTGPHVDGDAVHDGHSVLGLLALERADVDEAKRQLIQAGSTMGSPVLSSFGPDLALARRLLEAGERDAVLEYLSLCEKFWTSGRPRIQRWIETISAGGTPDLRTIQF